MITGLGHLAFRITDLEEALDFYCGKLGLREAFRLEREGEPSPWIVYIWVAPHQFLELFPQAQGKETTPEQLPNRSIGYHHLCLVVDDLQATLQELKERGLVLEGSPRKGLDHNWQYWISDPDGNPIELMQIMPESPQTAADVENTRTENSD
jgi:lactoylglutathione lyase